jgi:hypothetical protein
MKSQGYFRRLCKIILPVSHRTAAPFALLLLLIMVSACAMPHNDQPKDALYTQIYTDMMYGADDYFGQSTDLSYADGVVPTVVQPTFGTPTVVSATGTGSGSAAPTTTASAPTTQPVTVVPPPVVVVPPVGGG